MSKRFTASDKWEDPWFCGLGIKDQLFWIFILDKCNHAGIWQVNWRLVEFYIKGFKFNPEVFDGRILELTKEKWFIPKFIQFQYGTLNKANRAHASVIAMLDKEGANKELASPLLGDKVKDKEKDMVKDKDKVKDSLPLDAFEIIWKRYPRKLGKDDAEIKFKAQVKTFQDWLDIQNALDHFTRKLQIDKTEEKFIPHGSTWFNNRWHDWVNYTQGESHGANGSQGISHYTALARAARKSLGIGEPPAGGTIPARVRDLPDVPVKPEESDGTGKRGDVAAMEILRAGGFKIKPTGQSSNP